MTIKYIKFPRGFKKFAHNRKGDKQDVNSKEGKIHAYEAENGSLKHIMDQMQIKPSNIIDFCIIDLVQNVPSHDDFEFCKAYGIKSAAMVVIESRYFDASKYPDSPTHHEFFSDGKWRTIREGYAYKFDPRKTHALLNNSRLLVMVVFYKGRDAFD